jgi:opacity protein-like surface antigen
MTITGHSTRIAFIGLLGLLLPPIVSAQSGRAEERSGHWYIGGGIGGYSEEDNSQLANHDSGAALFFSGGYRLSPHVAVEADFLGWTQDFSTPASIAPGILSSAEARTDLTTGGLGGVIKFYLPVGIVDLYGGGGLGVYASNLFVDGTGSASGAQINETDTDWGYQLLLGADVYVARKITVGLEYRWLNLDANFEPAIAGKLDVGGQFFLMNVRGHF